VGIGCIWPPAGTSPIDPWAFPLLNTAILLASGVTITWTHRATFSGNRDNVIDSLFATLALGILFSLIQYYEYAVATFCINDGIYGSLFFVLTGFHGLHIIVGSIILGVCLVRQVSYHFTKTQHIGLVCGIWY
jgi:heme/copper-type cytochrome/quinol oxidase subunit 3